jgi:Protein kinase domain
VTLYRDRAGDEVTLGETIGQGGEGTVLAVPGDPRRCAKIFHRERAAERTDKLLAMVDRRPRLPGDALAWPVELLYGDGGALTGYLMPAVRGAAELHRYLVPDERAQLAGWLGLGDLHRLGARVAEIVTAIHEAGHCVGDLKPQNVLVSPLSGRVTLVDTDSFQIVDRDGRVHACPVFTPEYAAPELHRGALSRARRTPASDAFALAVLLYQLLMGGSHPFEGEGEGRVPDRIPRGLCPIVPGVTRIRAPPSALPFTALHPALREAFVRCFGPGHAAPEQRPSAVEWREVLARARRDLARCRRSPAHEHPRGQALCPWCERRERTGLDLFPAGQRWQRASLARAPDPMTAQPAERARWLALHVRGRMVGGKVTPAERAWLAKAGAALGFSRAQVARAIDEVAATPVVAPWARVVSRARSLLPGSLPRRAFTVPAAAALLAGGAILAGSWRPGGVPQEEPAGVRACAVGGEWAVIGNTGGRGAFLREAPSTSSGKIGLAEGTAVRLTGQHVRAGELTWSEVLVADSAGTGWVAARYLVEPR